LRFWSSLAREGKKGVPLPERIVRSRVCYLGLGFRQQRERLLMASTNPGEISAADTPTNQTRREALKRFGRYAAAAPTIMVLLQPRDGQAAKRRGGGSPRGGGSHY
jgi:hypothetical protein